MPNVDGLEACALLREQPTLEHVPILMLTAKTDEEDHVLGLDAGADIYLTKPISLPVLISQVRAALRGSGRIDPETRAIRVHDLVIDRERYIVRKAGGRRPVLTASPKRI